jgi:hypothetical protein
MKTDIKTGKFKKLRISSFIILILDVNEDNSLNQYTTGHICSTTRESKKLMSKLQSSGVWHHVVW